MDNLLWDRLITDLRNPDDIERSVNAREDIDRYADESWLPELHYLLANDECFYIRESMATPIIRLEGLRALPQLLIAYQRGLDEGHDNDGFTEELCDLIEMNAEEALPLLNNMQNDPDENRRKDAGWLLEFATEAISEDKQRD